MHTVNANNSNYEELESGNWMNTLCEGIHQAVQGDIPVSRTVTIPKVTNGKNFLPKVTIDYTSDRSLHAQVFYSNVFKGTTADKMVVISAQQNDIRKSNNPGATFRDTVFTITIFKDGKPVKGYDRRRGMRKYSSDKRTFLFADKR